MNKVTPIRNGFDPAAAFEQAVIEIDNDIAQYEATAKRLRRFHEAAMAELDRLRAERDLMEMFSEQEAAVLLRLSSRQALADLRYQHSLPHRKIGSKVVYTREDIDAILEYFKVAGVRRRTSSTIAGRKAA